MIGFILSILITEAFLEGILWWLIALRCHNNSALVNRDNQLIVTTTINNDMENDDFPKENSHKDAGIRPA